MLPDEELPRDDGLVRNVPAKARRRASRWTWCDWLLYVVRGVRKPPVPPFTAVVEPPEEGKVGIAVSGGGVRSAAFCLGALQQLQELKVLPEAAYVAAVSGGAYIASAFFMVRRAGGDDDSDPGLIAQGPPFFPGSPEETYLRNHIDYMAPGALGKLRLGMRVVLGMAWNMLVIGLFLALAGFAAAFAYRALYPALDQHIEHASCPEGCGSLTPAVPDGLWIPIAAVAAAAAAFGLLSMLLYPRWFELREALETWAIRLFVLAVLAGVLLIAIPELVGLVRAIGGHTGGGALPVTINPNAGKGLGVVGGAGLASGLAALVLYLRADAAEARRLAKDASSALRWYRKLAAPARPALAHVLATVAGPLLSLGVFVYAGAWILNRDDQDDRWWALGIAFGACLLLYVFSDLTAWSLHPFYRRRLESAFALKRVPGGVDPGGQAVERDPAELIRLADFEDPGRTWPTLLVCAAANVSDDAATPPGRSVTSITFSPSAIGGPLIGAVRTRDFEAAAGARRRAITLPAAVAMSGAALSPSMGKMTRPQLRFLLALANVRLGVWVPNPRRFEDFQERRWAFRPRLSYLFSELLGRNLIDAKFIYVTDGGHYDNLGIVELLRRGCTDIYCFDASNDDFDALGDAVALARGELGVDIQIDTTPLRPDHDTRLAAADCVAGRYAYLPGAGKPVHVLRYARPVMTADTPADARAYHRRDPHFPQDSTADQLYKDERFEAYRVLGARAAAAAAAAL